MINKDTSALERVGILGLLLLSASAVAVAPAALPESYSPVQHAISESAAQGTRGAWVGRLGLLFFGLAVLWLLAVAGPRWGRAAAVSFRTFGAAMLAAAVFAHRPWEPGLPFDATEDLLHSIAATGMGFSFAVGVAIVMVTRRPPSFMRRALDAIALAASVVIPLSMVAWPQVAGLLQRGMFAIAYIWYGRETLGAT